MPDRDPRDYERDGDAWPTPQEDEAFAELEERRSHERRQRQRRDQPELHGRPVSPALVEHEAQAADRLRDRLAAIAPQDPDGTTSSDGGQW